MKMVRWLTHAAVLLACCGTLIPQGAVAAGPADQKVRDVSLTANGSLTGVLLNSAGNPLDGAVVSVRQNGKEVARAVSTAQGGFEVAGLSSGVYEVAVGQQGATIRAWSANAAPPGAKQQAVLVVGEARRGQEYYPSTLLGVDFITLTTLTAAVGAIVISAVTLSKVNDIEDKVDDLKSP